MKVRQFGQRDPQRLGPAVRDAFEIGVVALEAALAHCGEVVALMDFQVDRQVHPAFARIVESNETQSSFTESSNDIAGS